MSVGSLLGMNNLSPQEVETIWDSLRSAFMRIQNHNPEDLSFEELYRHAYTLVLHKKGGLLYEGFQTCIHENLQSIRQEILSNEKDTELVACLLKKWEDHQTTMQMIKDILMYLDKNYVPKYGKTPVYSLGIQLFYAVILKNAQILTRLQSYMFFSIQKEREGEKVDVKSMRRVIAMLYDVGNHISIENVYKVVFEDPFLNSTSAFYLLETSHYINHATTPHYLQQAEKRFVEECYRVDAYLHSDSQVPLLNVLEYLWISDKYEKIVNNEKEGLAFLIDNDRIEDVCRLYFLFSRIPFTLTLVVQIFKQSIIKHGDAILEDQQNMKDSVKYINKFSELKKKFDRFLSISFRDNKDFKTAIKDAFEILLNKDSKSPFHLSEYADDFFKKSIKGLNDYEIEAKLNDLLTIFRFLKDKDIFEAYHKQHLSRRMLQRRSLSEEAERNLIAKLKAECGQQYTSKLEGMFKDISVSEHLYREFLSHQLQRKRDGLDNDDDFEFEAQILTTGTWPCDSHCINDTSLLPVNICQRLLSFSEFYVNKHNCRTITWNLQLGSAEIRGNWENFRYDISCTTLQMILLNYFNKKKSFQATEILNFFKSSISFKTPSLTTSSLPSTLLTDVKRHLLSLYASPKARILNRRTPDNSPLTKEFKDTDIFEINEEFQCKTIRIKIPLIALNSGVFGNVPNINDFSMSIQPGADVPSCIEQDRQHLVEAAIVRVMKSKKKIEHEVLVNLVVESLKNLFIPSASFVKNRIEKLIEREYMERDPIQRKAYVYLA